MGITPIEYRPWKGSRSEHGRRFLVIADGILRHSLRSKWFLAVLILGTFLTFALPMIFGVISPHESLTADVMASALNGGLYFIFVVILVSMVCSDLIAEDLRSSSLVLYLSRALRPDGYLLGKFAGAALTISLFAVLPPLLMALALTATQSGPDYASSLVVVGETFLAAVLTTVFLIPLGMLMSSLTRRRTYAAVGTFMVIIVLGIVAGIFSRYDDLWRLLSPDNVLYLTYDVIFGFTLPYWAEAEQVLATALVMTVPALLLVLYQVMRRGVGK